MSYVPICFPSTNEDHLSPFALSNWKCVGCFTFLSNFVVRGTMVIVGENNFLHRFEVPQRAGPLPAVILPAYRDLRDKCRLSGIPSLLSSYFLQSHKMLLWIKNCRFTEAALQLFLLIWFFLLYSCPRKSGISISTAACSLHHWSLTTPPT